MEVKEMFKINAIIMNGINKNKEKFVAETLRKFGTDNISFYDFMEYFYELYYTHVDKEK